MKQYLRTCDAARLLEVTPEYVRQLSNKGVLPAIKTVGGYRLFKVDDVTRLMQLRKQQASVTTKAQHKQE